MSEQEKGGAAAFIASVEKDVTANVDAMKVRQASQIARVKAVLQEIADEEVPFIVAADVPPECVTFAAIGTALGAGSAAMGELFCANKPDGNPIELMRTAATMTSVFAERAGF